MQKSSVDIVNSIGQYLAGSVSYLQSNSSRSQTKSYMLQDASIVEYKHKKFVERIVDAEMVWALESEDGFATSDSNEFENVDIIPFWSDKAYAAAAIKEDWKHYKPTSMSLADFIENWLVGMHNDRVLAGTNWDANMFGKEIEPLELALQIVDELLSKGKNLNLNKYNDILDYQAQVRRTFN